MRKFDQLYKLHHLLDGRRTPIRTSVLAERLECTEKTIRRYIEEFRDLYAAPIVHEGQGWLYDREQRDDWALPGIWMTQEETQSLMLLLDILNRFGNGLLNEELKAVRRRVDDSLASRGVSRTELERRIRIIPQGQRALPDHGLQHILSALIQRRRLMIRYRDFHDQWSSRTISPQRLVYYRDNWYVDGWCHLRHGLRTFSVARMKRSDPCEETAIEISEEELDAHLSSSYGVFAGEATETAVLRFLPPISTEISRQEWHPDQQGEWHGDDYLLSLPFSDPRELIQDLFRHLPNVIVEAPASLKEAVQKRLEESIERYRGTG